MSRIFEALQQSELAGKQATLVQPEPLPVEAPPQHEEGSAEELEKAQTLTLAVLPESDLPTATDAMGLAAEKFRLLALRLCQAQERRPYRRVLVTSGAVQDGKSMISANVAFTLAVREKKKVLLVEGDLRQPRLCQIYRTGRIAGLSDWMEQDKPIANFMYRLGSDGPWLLPAGHGRMSALEVLHSPRLAELMLQLSDWFDFIIIDSPPVTPLADTHSWETLVEATLLVVREGQTPKKVLQKALDALDRNKLLGAVLNEATLSQHKYYQYYGAAKEAKKGRSKETKKQ